MTFLTIILKTVPEIKSAKVLALLFTFIFVGRAPTEVGRGIKYLTKDTEFSGHPWILVIAYAIMPRRR